MRFNPLLLFPIAFILILIAIPPKPKAVPDSSVTQASLEDSLPPSFLQKVHPKEIQGYRVYQPGGSATYYFEYTADHSQVLKEIAALPFPADSVRADLECRVITQLSEVKQLEELLKDEMIASIFHQNEPIENYSIYQCIKAEQHFILLDKTSSHVIHIIQQG